MGIKDELFSFRGLLICVIHCVFAVGIFGVIGLGCWVWTGDNPIRNHIRYSDQKEAIEFLLDTNPGFSVKLVPNK